MLNILLLGWCRVIKRWGRRLCDDDFLTFLWVSGFARRTENCTLDLLLRLLIGFVSPNCWSQICKVRYMISSYPRLWGHHLTLHGSLYEFWASCIIGVTQVIILDRTIGSTSILLLWNNSNLFFDKRRVIFSTLATGPWLLLGLLLVVCIS